MKRVDRAPAKDTAIPTHPNLASRKANVKTDPEAVVRKNTAKSLKGPSVRYGHQSEVMEQNRLLTAAKEDLQKQISELKENVFVLEQRCSDLQESNTEIKKQLSDCHVLLIAENLDPVSGEKVCEAADQKAGQRKDLMTISQKLLTELKSFDDFTKEHRAHLTEVQNTVRSLQGAREQLYQERDSFCMYAENMERALEEAEKLLME
ncbi:small kinetochore-associated protein [Hemibagrus wyckioides]|nr:small kinetochore-associated protein [Hemibagrus wyckioides]XP_058236416.1 small kinetochore-associated protein [Hemibagrus wyckioides]XP_058236417.1 small kinetochore-associated protein [Hemibagrus wyckioides]XP_058236418.1 small kinetochore-associated protein [Hemibagrus wyckioides]